MIKQGLSQSNRLTELNRIAKEQLEVLYKNNQKALDNLKRLAENSPISALFLILVQFAV